MFLRSFISHPNLSQAGTFIPGWWTMNVKATQVSELVRIYYDFSVPKNQGHKINQEEAISRNKWHKLQQLAEIVMAVGTVTNEGQDSKEKFSLQILSRRLIDWAPTTFYIVMWLVDLWFRVSNPAIKVCKLCFMDQYVVWALKFNRVKISSRDFIELSRSSSAPWDTWCVICLEQ